jgi:8-oxo-dGTP pyrophosphatase MutT (NUDIX family)
MTAMPGARICRARDEIRATPFTWLTVAGTQRGRIIAPVLEQLRRLAGSFEVHGDGLALRDAGASVEERSRLLQQAAVALRAAGLVPGWRNELCALVDEDGAELARFERGAFRTLGLRNRAVHVNGVLPDGCLWIARRSPRKASSPNKLDNMAAGAIAAGESPFDCAVRELWEEAGVPAQIATLTQFTGGSVSSLRPLRHGIHDEIILCADIPLPRDFTPECQDGEVAEFIRMSRAQVIAALGDGEFSIEAGLVVADWLDRTADGTSP